MWRGDVILARGDIRTVALHHIIPVKGKQACEPKSFQSLRKLDRRTRIVHALEVSETSFVRKLWDRKPSLFNTFEIFDHRGSALVGHDELRKIARYAQAIGFHLFHCPARAIPCLRLKQGQRQGRRLWIYDLCSY